MAGLPGVRQEIDEKNKTLDLRVRRANHLRLLAGVEGRDRPFAG
jgi:hypothetical protein